MCNHETKVAQDRLPPHLRLFTFHLFYQRIHTHARAKNESDITNKRTWRIRRAPRVTSARVPSGMPPTGCFSFPSLDALTHRRMCRQPGQHEDASCRCMRFLPHRRRTGLRTPDVGPWIKVTLEGGQGERGHYDLCVSRRRTEVSQDATRWRGL